MSRIFTALHNANIFTPTRQPGEAIGFLLRVFISQPKLRTSLGYYIAMDSFVVLSPATFLAFNYITYGRLIRLCVGRKHSLLRPEYVGRTFVLSDIFTFFVQVVTYTYIIHFKR